MLNFRCREINCGYFRQRTNFTFERGRVRAVAKLPTVQVFSIEAQIVATRAESQWIVGQSLLSHLQYPVPYQSRLQRIYLF